MIDITLPESNDDIFSLGFDRSLNRGTGNDIPSESSSSNIMAQPIIGPSDSVIYDGVAATPAQSLTYGATVAGTQNSIFIADPSKGIYLGHAKFSQAPFRVNMNGDMRASGSIVGASLDIPDTTTTSSFHVDSSGNTWWGATTYAAAPAKVSAAGVAQFSGLSLVNTFTAGEAISAAGKLLCFKNKFAAWGDNASADRNTTAIMSKMTYVDGTAANINTNYSSANLCYQGQTAINNDLITYLQLDFTNSPPGLPVWNEIDTIYLRLYVVFAAGSTIGPIILRRVTSSWAEGTVTYNTKPTDDGVAWATGAVVVESYSSENNASTATGTTTGYVDFDITELYRLISQGVYTNNGFRIYSTGGGGVSCQFGGRTRVGGGTFNQAPFIVSYITKDNPGNGNTMTANDGKVYLASNANYQRIKQIAGVSAASASAAASVSVYGLADGSLIPSSVLTVTNNQDYYLNDNAGTIGVLTNNIIESSRWDIKIGVGSPSGLLVEKDNRPLFIRSHSLATCFPPPNCTMVRMNWRVDDAGAKIYQGQVQVTKGFITSGASGGDSVSDIYGNIVWNSGTAGTVDSGLSSFGGGTGSYTLYFFK